MGGDAGLSVSMDRRSRNIDEPEALRGDAPESCRAAVTKHSMWPARQDRCHPPPPRREFRPANHIDTALHLMQTPLGNAVLHSLRAQPKLKELPPRDHPMLRPRQTPRSRGRVVS
jgi:hypothetical protein